MVSASHAAMVSGVVCLGLWLYARLKAEVSYFDIYYHLAKSILGFFLVVFLAALSVHALSVHVENYAARTDISVDDLRRIEQRVAAWNDTLDAVGIDPLWLMAVLLLLLVVQASRLPDRFFTGTASKDWRAGMRNVVLWLSRLRGWHAHAVTFLTVLTSFTFFSAVEASEGGQILAARLSAVQEQVARKQSELDRLLARTVAREVVRRALALLPEDYARLVGQGEHLRQTLHARITQEETKFHLDLRGLHQQADHLDLVVPTPKPRPALGASLDESPLTAPPRPAAAVKLGRLAAPEPDIAKARDSSYLVEQIEEVAAEVLLQPAKLPLLEQAVGDVPLAMPLLEAVAASFGPALTEAFGKMRHEFWLSWSKQRREVPLDTIVATGIDMLPSSSPPTIPTEWSERTKAAWSRWQALSDEVDRVAERNRAAIMTANHHFLGEYVAKLGEGSDLELIARRARLSVIEPISDPVLVALFLREYERGNYVGVPRVDGFALNAAQRRSYDQMSQSIAAEQASRQVSRQKFRAASPVTVRPPPRHGR